MHFRRNRPSTALRAETPLREVIDAEIKAVWQREKISPAGRADDAAFLRRIHLDLVGTIPTYEETPQFLVDPCNKRAKLIDRLLEDPRYATHMADIWQPILFGRNPSSAPSCSRTLRCYTNG